MVKTEHEIVEKVYAAKTDSQAADALIQQYLGFIRNEVARAVYQTDNGREDEESIAMFAFYEAILSYKKAGVLSFPMPRGQSETALSTITAKKNGTERSFPWTRLFRRRMRETA